MVEILFSCNLFDANKPKLISAKRSKDIDDQKDCRVIGDCVSEKIIKDDTLYMTIYFNNDCRDLSNFRNSISFHNDTLNLKLEDPAFVDQNPIRNKNGMWEYKIPSIKMTPCIGGYDTQRIQYKLTGFQKLPKVVEFNKKPLCDCYNNPIKFALYNNDTINMVNANGKKDGLWLEFHANGKISEQIYYANGEFVKGTTFDKNGKNLHIVGWSVDDISGIYSDTIPH